MGGERRVRHLEHERGGCVNASLWCEEVHRVLYRSNDGIPVLAHAADHQGLPSCLEPGIPDRDDKGEGNLNRELFSESRLDADAYGVDLSTVSFGFEAEEGESAVHVGFSFSSGIAISATTTVHDGSE